MLAKTRKPPRSGSLCVTATDARKSCSGGVHR
jgi:hypothetical protein